MARIFDWKEYAKIARRTAAEGSVLLKNDNHTLPAKDGEKIALFGRTQFDYLKSGTGSGGLVNTPYCVNIYDGFLNNGACLDEELANTYKVWLEDHPFDNGVGWANEPWSQDEMPVSLEDAKKYAQRNDVAIIVLGRLAGEDKDNTNTEGSYLLRQDERELIKNVTASFDRVAVLLNVGNICDMKWVEEYNPGAVMYIWQGGMEGGNAAYDVVSGQVNPCGALADTIAYNIEDYPSTAHFGNPVQNFFAEDIYVGYRYFETFAKEKVLYPFGFGLSYTTFETTYNFNHVKENYTIEATVTNTGDVAGKHIVEAYVEAPCKKLFKPSRVLVSYAKTRCLNPGESETLVLDIRERDFASFDDSGVSGFLNAFILEAGDYNFYAGDNVRSAKKVATVSLEKTKCLEVTEAACYPIVPFERMTGKKSLLRVKPVFEPTPLRRRDWKERRNELMCEWPEISYRGDAGYTLKDVKEGRIDMDTFISQLSDGEMIAMTRGEGMSSVRVTPGTCAAYGGVTDSLLKKGVPAAACTDGPSGLRIDCGVLAMQGSNGTSLACTFDKNAVDELYTYMGMELNKDHIECLLGPGMNIHRSPLNGRNFEYFSEDPYLTGTMAAAELLAMAKNQTTGCIKHFCCNNQELKRHEADSVVSARALREIYLRGYEIAVKDGKASHIMTTYGPVNGTHTATYFDLNTLVLRKDWEYKGLTMTDWWTVLEDENGENPTRDKTSFMVRAQNDIYMVTTSSENNDNHDDTEEGLKNKVFTRAELQRNVKNILNVVMNTPAYDRLNNNWEEWEEINVPVSKTEVADVSLEVTVNRETTIDASLIDTRKGAINQLHVNYPERGEYTMYMEIGCEGPELAQIPLTFTINNTVKKVVTRNGGDGEFREEVLPLEAGLNVSNFVKLVFGQDGMKLRNIRLVKEK